VSAAGASVRAAGPQDWQALRALRLEALEDTPIGFLEQLADAREHDEAAWRARAQAWTAAPHSALLFAERDGLPVGMLGLTDDPSWVPPGAVFVLAVYLQPGARGAGVLGALVGQAEHWARGRGADRMLLEVHEDNARAQRAYARVGFADTGERSPYDPDPTQQELVMERSLRP